MKQQRGGTILGFILGLVVGLALALAVAVYVTKVPMQFINKAQSGGVNQDATEAQNNKDWNPNTPLHGKNQALPGLADAPATAPTPATAVPAIKPAAPELKPAVTADPLGDLAKARAGNRVDPYSYFVQVGAFRTPEDAESQRAKLSLAGIDTKVTEREQSGRKVFRVRLGPFDKRDEADQAKARLDGKGIDAALVRVQR